VVSSDDSLQAAALAPDIPVSPVLGLSKVSEPQGDERPANVGRGVAGRISALDFTKGMLVLTMVLYHWLNYYFGPVGYFYRYLRFLPPSFICITGFLIAYVYISRDRIANSRLPRRLAVRGLKVLAIFIVLNAVIRMALPKPETEGSFFEILSPASLWSIYISGNMRGGRLVAFYVLVPISYLLILSAFLLIVSRYYKHVFHAATILALLGVMILDLFHRGSGHLGLLCVGLLGVSIGYIPMDRINHFLRRPVLLVLAYLLYVAAISVWDVPYPLQVTGVLLSLMLIYLLGKASGEGSQITKALILLGRYSLFAYIAQIAILQLLRRATGRELSEPGLLFSLVVAASLTVISVQIVHWARTRVPIVNYVYAAVFS
jgi:peptidoglycan/LPS O-acetylase OafA/YrhL